MLTLQQLSDVRHWHIVHHQQDTLEYHLWDAMLTCWVLGCIGTVPAWILEPWVGLPLCALLFSAPGAYVRLRRRLHRVGRLRCDWLTSLRLG